MSRRAAAAFVAAGLLLGTLADDRSGPPPQREAGTGEWILAADFHVHAFFGDAGLAPWDLQREARRARLDVVAITNHGGLFGGRINEWWSARVGGPLVLAGQEVTAPGYHLIAAGIQRPVDARQPAAAAIADVQAQGGVAIAAHPTRTYAGYDDGALARLDGVEAAHPDMHSREGAAQEIAAFHRRAAARDPQPAAIGSSDFHVLGPLGITRTFVLARQFSRDGVLDAIRRGQAVASDRHGRLHGDPVLVARVQAHRDRTGHGVRPPAGPWIRIAVLLALLGLLALVLVDPATRQGRMGHS